ncbi:MAG: class I SAM-dependent methyltransferase [Bacteroidota bacterium]
MALEFHKDKQRYFQMQHDNAAEYVIPFIERAFELKEGMHVCEIGCAEGGVLLAFLERGMTGVGVELSESRAELAEGFLAEHIEAGKARVISKNIYDPTFETEFRGQFDLIILKDVIEHIPDQPKLMAFMKTYLKPGGHIFFGFPPWQMPFGGHQQLCKSRMGKMPWQHLLPKFMYRGLLKLYREDKPVVEELMEIVDTRISLERFQRIARQTGYQIAAKQLYLFNPIYKWKFKVKPRKQNKIVGAIPWVRNFWTTCGYYLLGVADDAASN